MIVDALYVQFHQRASEIVGSPIVGGTLDLRGRRLHTWREALQGGIWEVRVDPMTSVASR